MPLDSSGTVRKRRESDEIFLSPRVIDEAAFEDFAARLKRAIDHAGSETAGLRGLLDDLRGAGASLDAMAQRHTEQSTQSAALDEELTRQRARVKKMLERVVELNEKHAAFEQGVDGVLARREVELAQRVDAALEQFGGTLEHSAKDLLGAVDERVARVEGQIERTLAKFENTLETRLTQAVQNAESRIEQCVSQAREQLADVETARATLEHQVEEVVGTALDALRTECDRAAGLIDGSGDREPLRATLNRADELAERIGSVLESGERSEQRLASSFNGINERMDETSRRYMALEESLRKAIRASNSTEKLLASRTDDVRNMSQAMDGVRARADQSIQTLQRITVQGEASSASGKSQQKQLSAMVEQGERLLGALEPWRAVMLAHSAAGKLPEEMDQVVQRVRRSVLKEYMQGGKPSKPIGEQVELKQDPTQSAVQEKHPAD